MKRTWILCLIGLFYLGSVASSQAQQTGGIEKAVAALEEQWLQSQKTNNPDLVAPLLADKAAELAKYPQGATVGIVGAPAAMPIRTGNASQWAVCDTAPAATAKSSAGEAPVVTAIAGPLSLGQRSAPLRMPNAILGRSRSYRIAGTWLM